MGSAFSHIFPKFSICVYVSTDGLLKNVTAIKTIYHFYLLWGMEFKLWQNASFCL